MRLVPRTRGGALWRFLLASVLVIGLTAGTTAVAGLLQVKNIVNDLNLTPALKDARVTLPPPGAPETLLLIGSDHRAGTSYRTSNTDTMMLVRLDDNSQTINLLSVPRDLKVQIPLGGVMTTQKLNAAYSVGGPNLLIKTLQDQVFPGLKVNHILDVNFSGFASMIDAIGCVYADVDHRYYNNTALTDYSSIDIQPGYQKLCGGNNAPNGALAFVRFRHTDSDLVRNARQQDFVRWTKQGYSTSQLLADEGKLLHIFGEHVQTDHFLHTTDGLLDLFNLVINADKLTLKSIKFPAILDACGGPAQTPCYVSASPAAEARTFRAFMTPTVVKPKAKASGHPSAQTFANHPVAPARASNAGLAPDPADGRSQAAQLGRTPLPVLYPKLIVAGSRYCFAITGDCNDPQEPAYEYNHSYPRKYVIHGYGNRKYPSYVMTLVINSLEGEYYTIQGTTWRTPPILRSPTKIQFVNGKKLAEYYNGPGLSVVAYHTPRAVYWISNTLTDSIPPSQMIGMAASLAAAS